MTKKELRAVMRQRNMEIAPEKRLAAADRIYGRVERSARFIGAGTVAFFSALPDEPPTGKWLERWSRIKQLVLPRVEGETMQFYDYDPLTMERGAFGILEPGGGASRCAPHQIDLVIVPGTAFSAEGYRCGRGRGYYDRYLSQEGFRASKIGVCYAHQLVESLPCEEHDVRMDEVIADRPDEE